MLDESRERINKILDRILIWGSLVGAMIFGLLLFQADVVVNYFLKTQKSDFKIVGQVVKTKNDVRRRMGQSLTWYPVSINEKLFERDSVFTGEESDISFQIDNGDEINLSSESLVVIENRNNEILLDLKVGTLAANTTGGRKVNIIHEGQVATLESKKNAKVQITKAKSGRLKITSQSNDVELKLAGNKESIKKNEELDLGKELKITKKKYTAFFTSHDEYDKIWQMKGEPVALTWSSDDKKQNLKLQIAKSKSFAKMTVNELVSNSGTNWIPDAIEGNYFLRLVDASSENPASIIHQIDIRDRSAVQLISPEDRKKIMPKMILAAKEKKTVSFKWHEKQDVSHYEISISKYSDFSESVQSLKSESNSISIDLSQGIYYWRVRSFESSQREHAWSESRIFDLGQAPPIVPNLSEKQNLGQENQAHVAPYGPEKPSIPYGPQMPQNWSPPENNNSLAESQVPVINNKSQKITLEFNSKVDRHAIASMHKNLKNPPLLEWQTITNENEYEIQIDSSKQFDSKNIFKTKVLKNSFSWQNAVPGQFFWRVKKVSPQESAFSEIAEMRLNVKPPQFVPISLPEEVVSDEKDKTVPKKIKLKWNRVSMAAAYRFNENGKSKDVSVAQLEVFLVPNTKNTFKVAALNEQKVEISDYAEMQLNYKKVIKVLPPRARLPANETTIVAFEAGQVDPIVFMWSDVKGVSKYELEFAKDKEFKNVLKMEIVSDTKYILKQAIHNGKVFWRVRGYYNKNFTPWSDVRTYVVQVVN